MRYIIIAFMGFIFSSQMLGEAEAQAQAQIGNTGLEELYFYSETTIPQADNTELSLCQLTTTHSKFGINYWRSIDGYVLSANKCVGYTYLKITPEQFNQAKKAGMIPSDTPEKPVMSWAMLLGGFYGILLAGLLILAAISLLVYRTKKST